MKRNWNFAFFLASAISSSFCSIFCSTGLVALLGWATQAQAQTPTSTQSFPVYLGERIVAAEFFKSHHDTLFFEEACRRPEALFKAIEGLTLANRVSVLGFIQEHEKWIPEKILLPLVYWKWIKKSAQNERSVLQYWFRIRQMTLRDYVDHPLKKNPEDKARARELLTAWSRVRSDQLSLRSKELTLDLRASFPDADDYSLTALGFIPGNTVELISENEVSLKRIDWFNERAIFAGGSLDFSQPYMKMPLSPSDEGHPSFQEPIFARIRDMIRDAKQSVFIDIFLFGGTLGGTLAKFLLDQAEIKKQANPEFRILILHDFATNYNMKEEMMPVFEYIRDRIATEPLRDSVYLLQANIQRHPPGIPFGISNLVPRTEETFKVLETRNTYYESKIDHSKVIVIDPESDMPQAYFGSKNWSDHSGGYYYDDALFVKGPAAALVQYSYYDDIDAALTTDKEERKWFFFKDQGFSNEAYLKNRAEILNWFKLKRRTYPSQGGQVVRLVETNVDGKINETRNVLIDMIAKAEKHIYMEQLFIYDKYVNDALMKRKKQIPDLDVRILADHNGNFSMGGLPNTLFLDQLLHHGIQVQARRTLGVKAQFKDGTEQEYHQENHRKITSVDGKILLVGSANLNPDTLQGSFREFGAQIFDTQVIGKFEKAFNKDWNDRRPVGPFYEGSELQLVMGGKTLSPEKSRLLNNIGAKLLRSKDDLERR